MSNTQREPFMTHHQGIERMKHEYQTIQNIYNEIQKCFNTRYIDISQKYVDKIDAILERIFNDQHTIEMSDGDQDQGKLEKTHITQPIFTIHNTRNNSCKFVYRSCDEYDYKTYSDELIESFILSPDTLELPQWIREHPNIEDIETNYTPDNKRFTIRFKTLLEPKDRCNLDENIIVTNRFPNYELNMIVQRNDLFVEQMSIRMKSFIRKSKFSEYIDLKYSQTIYISRGAKRELSFQLYKFTPKQELDMF